MYLFHDKANEKTLSKQHDNAGRKNVQGISNSGFENLHADHLVQRQLQGIANNNSRTENTASLSAIANANSPTSPIQLKIADDLNGLGLGGIYDVLIRSNLGQRLANKADEMNVRIVAGPGRARTDRAQGSNRITVQVPVAGRSQSDILQDVTFELNNAIRQERFDAANHQAVSGAIADPDEYARRKIEIETEGVLTTGQIGIELRNQGVDVALNKMYIPSFLKYNHERQFNPALTRAAYAKETADEVLDRPHELGSHRSVYAQQFENYANPGNKDARDQNTKLRTLADQVITMSKFSNYKHAVQRLINESSEASNVANWVANQRDAKRYKDLYLAFLAERVERNPEGELPLIGRGDISQLFSWVEHHDEGQYRNLAQILGLHLGYYDERPELLRTNIFRT